MTVTKPAKIPLIYRACRTESAAPTVKSDARTFFRAWTENPLRVASITPSADALSKLITSEISSKTGPVIELGPGTGVFTRALLDQGVKEKDLTLVEFGSDFAAMLQSRFPHARVLQIDARRLALLESYEGWPAGAVVSGLPLLSMPTRNVFAILLGSFRHMGEKGRLYQFTYGPHCPVPRQILDRLGLKAVCIGSTYRNVPPASVYRISRRQVLK